MISSATGLPASRAVLLACGLLIAAAAPACAQSFLGRGAPRALTLPGAEADAAPRSPAMPRNDAPVAAPAGAPTRGEASPGAALPQRPFPALGESLRLSGEESALRWPVYVTAEQARERLRLRIGYLAAISVVPEASFLTATVNDVVVGRTTIRAPGAVRVIEFDIPAGALRPGYNAVEIGAVQRHRVDCSIAATYELWTQIDPSWTGLVMPAGVEAPRVLHDLPAVPPDAGGAVPIRVVLRNKPGFQTFEKIVGLLQRVALAGRYAQVAVEFGPLRAGAGLNLVIGSPDDLRDLPGLDPALVGAGQSLAFAPASPERAATLVVPGGGPADLDAAGAVLAASAARAAEGSPQGLRLLALADGLRMHGGETLPLSRFGVQNREFSGRLFRTGFDVSLPADFIAADYAKATLALAGGYAAGLDTGARVIVDVNGRNVVSDTLPRADGDVFRDVAMPLPLERWRPGRNRIEITALLPSPADRTCADGAAESKRFLFLSDTTLTIPPLARALRLPDLAATASGGLPYLDAKRRPRLIVPAPDRESMSAAATIAVRMALSAGRPIPFEMGNDGALQGRAPTVVVGPARSLDPELLRAVGFDPDQIRGVWEGRSAMTAVPADPLRDAVPGLSLDRLRRDIPPSCALPASAARGGIPGLRRPQSAGSEAESRDLASSWSTALGARNAVGDRLSDAASRLNGALGDGLTDIRHWLSDQVRDRPVAVGASASLAVGQGFAGLDGDATVTVFTAPNAATLQAAATCLGAPIVWEQLQGRAATLDANEGTVTTVAANQTRIIETAPLSLENSRLVLAGWFATNPNTFVLILLAAAVALGLSTRAMLGGVGRANGAGPAANDPDSER
ncbi:cellulose biosynthesis cyclic di-GMP-binding regulatory protein BcsB [Methylobacterium sp. NEAU 140]|uniref:cellulose biosynthesis cyclic di-GMP-binding regulatory protein BcsB n=1 Tax=Methylobacterium sp. NEAU 140 TaxID=3064945 RepID=UPI0027356D34|nr:cellulose biosynthesis cyclic di-GMP-binding regulatory protein BcsB [Methylobacterium sp. NEAU 140]MDP4022410.1 cellulose biosynthesis cyclic di-GMP-binding regulatory protein BcsB [Methylobacterium sp. NEAU 140]